MIVRFVFNNQQVKFNFTLEYLEFAFLSKCLCCHKLTQTTPLSLCFLPLQNEANNEGFQTVTTDGITSLVLFAI